MNTGSRSRPASPPLSPRERSPEREELRGQKKEEPSCARDHYIQSLRNTATRLLRRFLKSERELANCRREVEAKDEEIKELLERLEDVHDELQLVVDWNEELEPYKRLCENGKVSKAGNKERKNVILSWSEGTSVRTADGVVSQSDMALFNRPGVGGNHGNYQFSVPVVFNSSNSLNANGDGKKNEVNRPRSKKPINNVKKSS